MVIDHIDGNTSNNSKANLREVSPAENARNRKGLQPNNKSGVAGVSWYRPTQKWYVQLKYNGRPIYGGYYEDFDEAVEARRQLEIKYGVHKHSLLNKQPKEKTSSKIDQAYTGLTL
jgi:hypothetical protein